MSAAFVLMHSYYSRKENWRAVVFGTRARPGRLRTALALARRWEARLMANDGFDPGNARLYRRLGIENLDAARNTLEEARGFLAAAPRDATKIFVSSPDHLPRVARDVLALGGENVLFAASATPYTAKGPRGVLVSDTPEAYGLPGPREDFA